MMYEFRFYAVAHGRLAAELALVHEMAIAGAPAEPGGPPAAGPSLWDRHGVPRPVGSWTVLSGRRVPGFLYIVKWNSLAEREDRFPRFWADPFWRARRERLTDGMPLVDGIENWLLEPSAAWSRHRGPAGTGPVGGLHELRVQHVAEGTAGAAADVLAGVDLPMLRSLGARILGVFDVAVGPGCPALVTLLAWPDLATRARAWRSMDGDPRIAGRAGRGERPFGAVDQYLLEPMGWNLPEGDLGFRS